MTLPKEIQVQKWIQEKLTLRNIYPLTVFFTYSGRKGSTLGLSFYSFLDLEEVLDLLDYKSLCDKNGFIINRDYNSLIIFGQGILQLPEKL